jgi:solute carrier family 15 (peptide/histidine transporter), member 3/4
MMILVLSATLPLISTIPKFLPAWTNTGSFQHIIFFVGLYMVGVGFGAQSPCVTSFAADQFDDTDEEEKTRKSSFFNWLHFAVNAGALISGIVLVWIQDHKGWLWAFLISTLFVALGAGSFFLGSTVYRFLKPGGSPVTRVCQVIVAATHNINTDLPCDSSLLYEIPGQVSAIVGSRKLDHTAGLEYYSETYSFTVY